MTMQIQSADAALTETLARILAAMARPGQAILLEGPVGAGKSHFARAFIRARMENPLEEVPSPTFTLVQTYADPHGVEIWHADLYRLTDASELDELGLEDALETAICLIEWPERMARPPDNALKITLQPVKADDLRDISLCGEAGLLRSADRAQFVAQSGWDDAEIFAVAGDASARQYLRLRRGAQTAILMDDPTGNVPAFTNMTQWLREHGFAAPEILAEHPQGDLLLLEDLGNKDLCAQLREHPESEGETYARVVDTLVDLHQVKPPSFVAHLDGSMLAEQVGLFAEWYPQAVGLDNEPALSIAAEIARLHADLAADVPPVLALRDFHSQNLIWRGDAPFGLIDYQDAVACHPAYDLVSVLQDARREVSVQAEAAALSRYIAATGREESQFRAAYALLGVQRQLRIIGNFVRLCLRDGKPQYLQILPRLWGYIMRNLQQPELHRLAEMVMQFPAPSESAIEKIRRQCARH